MNCYSHEIYDRSIIYLRSAFIKGPRQMIGFKIDNQMYC